MSLLKWNDVVFGIVVGFVLAFSWFDFNKVYQQPIEENEFCHDTATQTAWVARRVGELRCFLEYKQFPHRVKGVNIDAINE